MKKLLATIPIIILLLASPAKASWVYPHLEKEEHKETINEAYRNHKQDSDERLELCGTNYQCLYGEAYNSLFQTHIELEFYRATTHKYMNQIIQLEQQLEQKQ